MPWIEFQMIDAEELKALLFFKQLRGMLRKPMQSAARDCKGPSDGA